MKLSTRDASANINKPDPKRCGLLIFGADAMRVALKRQQVIAALIGPTGEEEMRLTRMSGAELRKDPAALQDAVKAQSFFPGARVAFIEEATDGLAKVVTAALEDWREGDAQIVVTAGSLTPRSALRKLFEGHRNAFATAIYDDPPTREEIEADLAKAGLTGIGGDAMQELVTLSRVLDPGDFRQVIEKLALYKLGDDAPVSAQDVTDCAPATVEAALDDVLNCVAEGRKGEIGPIVRKLQGQGVMALGIRIGATRHFRALHVAASDPGGVDSGIAKARVFGPRRDRMVRQARSWGVQKLEQALQMLTETDLTLRSSAPAPQMAVIERTLIRLAMLGQR